MFRLTMCVVSVLFPNRNFELNSFALFRVVMWNHAEIVSTLLSFLQFFTVETMLWIGESL